MVFSEVLEYLIEGGYVKLENYFVDGTKIEANANKYKWVWAKSTAHYKERLQEKIQELLEEIEQENEAEQDAYGDKDLEEVGEGTSRGEAGSIARLFRNGSSGSMSAWLTR